MSEAEGVGMLTPLLSSPQRAVVDPYFNHPSEATRSTFECK